MCIFNKLSQKCLEPRGLTPLVNGMSFANTLWGAYHFALYVFWWFSNSDCDTIGKPDQPYVKIEY